MIVPQVESTRPTARALTALVWLLVALFIPAAAAAQRLPFRSYDRSDGLPSDYINCIAQDSAGFMWFGTDRGLSRYDGAHFVNFTQADGLPDPFITCLYPDTDGTLWFGTFGGGAVHYDGTDFTTLDTGAGLPSNNIERILRDDSGTLFIQTEEGPSCVIGDSIRTRPETSRSYIIALRGDTLIYPEGNGFVRLGASPARGLYAETYDFPTTLFRVTDGMRGVRGFQTSDGDVYVFPLGGLFRLRRRANGTFGDPDLIARVRIEGLTEDRAGNLWAATATGGLWKIDGDLITRISVPDGLPDTKLMAVYVDYEGNVWASILGRGVVKLTDFHVRRYTSAEGLQDDNTQCVTIDAGHRTWIGTQGGLNVIANGELKKIGNPRGHMDGVRAVETDPGGNMYVGTLRYVFGPAAPAALIRGDRIPRHVVPFGTSGLAPGAGSAGNDLLIGTFGDGIYRALPDTVVRYPTLTAPPSTMIEGVVRGSTGPWFLTRNSGIFRIVGGRILAIDSRQGLPSNSVYALHEMEDSRPDHPRLWIGTDNGLVRYIGGDVRIFGSREGLVGSPVTAVLPAGPAGGAPRPGVDAGMGSVLVVTPEALHLVRNDSLVRLQSLSFLAGDGAALNNASYDTASGLLWLATTRGLYRLEAGRETSDPVPPRIAITSVRVGALEVPASLLVSGARGEISLPPLQAGRNDVTVEYAGLSFVNEGRVLCQTRLDPVDTGYSEPGTSRSSMFRSLTDGEYVFHVRAVNEWNIASSAPAVIRFTILPPYWKRWWFIGGALLLTLGVAAAGTRAVILGRTKRTLAKFARERELQEERERISRDLHDHVGGQLAGLISGLELANRYGDTDEEKRRSVLASLREDARTSMAQLRETIWALQASSLTLAAFCAEIRNYGNRYFRYLPAVRFTLDTAGDTSIVLQPREVLELFRVVQEALANALKHAEPSKVAVSARVDADGLLTLTVTNDGAETGTAQRAPMTGRGIGNMRKRMESLGGTLECRAEAGGTWRVSAVYTIAGAGRAEYP